MAREAGGRGQVTQADHWLVQGKACPHWGRRPTVKHQICQSWERGYTAPGTGGEEGVALWDGRVSTYIQDSENNPRRCGERTVSRA